MLRPKASKGTAWRCPQSFEILKLGGQRERTNLKWMDQFFFRWGRAANLSITFPPLETRENILRRTPLRKVFDLLDAEGPDSKVNVAVHISEIGNLDLVLEKALWYRGRKS